MAGKNFIKLLLIFFLTSLSKCQTDESVFIKGGLLFEKAQAAPVYINPPTALFNKYINYSSFEDTIIQAKIFESSYTNFCDTLNEKLAERIKTYETRLFVSPDTYRIDKALEYCKLRDAKLPEIRNLDEYRNIVKFAKIHDIHLIIAGIYADSNTNTFKFESDDAEAYDGHIPFR